MSTPSSDRRPLLAAIALFVVALVLRVCGIGWGLPNDLHNYSLHPDEGFTYSVYAYPEGKSVFVPGNYNYPTLYPIALRIAGEMVATYGGYETPSTVPRLDYTRANFAQLKEYYTKLAPHQRATNTAGRFLNCLAGAGTAVVVFFILLRFSGIAGAMFGGLLAAIAPSFVVHSRFQTVDVFATFFMWLSILYAVKLYLNSKDGNLDQRYAILAGIFAGLSAGTKYTGGIAILSLIIALALTRRHDWVRLMIFGVLACGLAFVLSTPGAILDTKELLEAIQSEREHMRQGHDISFVHTPHGMLFQLGNLFTGIGPVAFIIGMLGLLYGAIKRRGWAWVILATVLAYFVIVGTSEVKFVRYGLPLVPAVCIGFGYAINGLLSRPRLRIVGFAAGAVAVLGLESLVLTSKPSPYWACFDTRFAGVVGTLRFTQDMMKEDPRDTAARHVLSLTKSDPNATISIFRVPWYWTVPVVKDTVLLYSPPVAMDAVAFQNSYFRTTQNPHVERSRDMPGAGHAVLSTLETSPFDRIQSAAEVPDIWRARYVELNQVLQEIHKNYDIVATYGGEAPVVEDMMHIQPKAYVLKRK